MTAYAHLAAVVPGFEALEYRHMDIPWYDDLVDGIDKPMITNGHMNVPEGPGRGIMLNQSALSAHGATTWTRVVRFDGNPIGFSDRSMFRRIIGAS